ncbi:hypothetical protein [Chitinophaga barathri]|uniref:Uncharacterized protein n=1 Tax=Chitinophaga barathri TaxID=1647451 RepID=A0A3N4MF72_9BACT|nr:hypothetical protein [Chitinophaga barathri]RPD42662.1 hypothetical protein EG028_05715 [Chitinophaga barathri]
MITLLTLALIVFHLVVITRLLTVDAREKKPNRLHEPTMKQIVGFCALVLVIGGSMVLVLPGILVGYLGDWVMRKNGKNKS